MRKTQNTVSSAPAKHRILGWIRRRVRKNPKQIWFRFDAKEFAEFTGLSIRAVRYALNQLRDDPEYYGFEWRTAFNRSRGSRGSWEVLYAPAGRLAYDCEPLFRDRQGKERHLRKNLRDESLSPPDIQQMLIFPASNEKEKMKHQDESESPDSDRQEPEVSATPIKSRDTTYLSRVETPRRWREGGVISPDGERKLKRKASAIARKLEREHWDTCKVRWRFYPARKYAFDELRKGFSEEKIIKAYAVGLVHRNRDATDAGIIFNPSSTITKARSIMAGDTSVESDRVTEFYRNRDEMRIRIRESLEKSFC